MQTHCNCTIAHMESFCSYFENLLGFDVCLLTEICLKFKKKLSTLYLSISVLIEVIGVGILCLAIQSLNR